MADQYTDIKFEIKGQIGIITVNTLTPAAASLRMHLTLPSSTAPKRSTRSAATSSKTPSRPCASSTSTRTPSSPSSPARAASSARAQTSRASHQTMYANPTTKTSVKVLANQTTQAEPSDPAIRKMGMLQRFGYGTFPPILLPSPLTYSPHPSPRTPPLHDRPPQSPHPCPKRSRCRWWCSLVPGYCGYCPCFLNSLAAMSFLSPWSRP